MLGRERQAAEFVSFYEARRRSLAEKLAGARRSRVFMHAHAGGAECCGSPGKGTFDDFITAAGGENIAAALIPGASGLLSLEQVLALDPEVYIATGGTHLARSGGLVLGLGVPRDVASRSFAALIGRPEFNALSAIRRRRAFALWQLFNDTPLHIAAIEAMAKSLHPDRFAELDPMATVSEISQRFSAIPLDGTFWLGPKDLPPGP